jgi:hypothetical protein
MLEVHQGFKRLLINGVGLIPDGQIGGLRLLRRCVNINTEFAKSVKPGESWTLVIRLKNCRKLKFSKEKVHSEC